jgi:hypothetical protein
MPASKPSRPWLTRRSALSSPELGVSAPRGGHVPEQPKTGAQQQADQAAQVLALAQQTAEAAIANAHQEAARIIADARQQAEQIIADARRRAQQS